MVVATRVYNHVIIDADHEKETLIVERPEWGPRGLVGRVSIEHFGDDEHGEPKVTSYALGTVSLTSLQERQTLFNLLVTMYDLQKTEPEPVEGEEPVERPFTRKSVLWQLAAFFDYIQQQENLRFSPVDMRTVQVLPPDKLIYELDGFALLRNHPTIFFGQGDSCKSLVAFNLVGQLAQMGVRVLVLDYELFATDHAARMIPMFGGMPFFHHMRCTAPIRELVPVLQDHVANLGIQYIVVDSIAQACGSEPEKSEGATNYKGALEDIGEIGTLSIAHRTKQSQDPVGEEKPFGSGFWHHFARETYMVTQDLNLTKGDTRKVTLACRKANLRPRPVDVEVTLDFSNGGLDVAWGMTRPDRDLQERRAFQEAAFNALASLGPAKFDPWKEASGLRAGNFATAKDDLIRAKRVHIAGDLFVPVE